jgi:hypothetical protein
MANSITAGGFYFPPLYGNAHPNPTLLFSSHSITVSAGVAMVGRLYLQGQPAEKLFSSAGGTISFRHGASAVWTAVSSLAIGLQDVNLAGGPPGQPDLVYDVSTTITSSTTSFDTNTWVEHAMTSGSKSLSHGAMYAIVVRMGTRVSTDSASVAGITGIAVGTSNPHVTTLSAGTAWGIANAIPNVLIKTDDGTLGWLEGGYAISTFATLSISSGSTTNDEYGIRFVLPFTAQVDSLAVKYQLPGGAANTTVCLYSDPNGTPTTITSVAIDGSTWPINAVQSVVNIPLQNNVTLTASTTFVLSVIPTTATAITLQIPIFADEAHKITWPGGGSCAAAARIDGAGAFSMNETWIPMGFGVRIHEIIGTTVTATTTTTITTTVTVGGAGGGMVVHPGMTGGVRG